MYDANKSVSSTGGISHEKIDKVVGDYYGSLTNYMEELSLKKRAGEDLSQGDEAMLRKDELYKFNIKLIKGRFIEDFNSAGTSDREVFIEELSSHIHKRLGDDADFISTMLYDLVDKGCIEITKKGTGMTANWI
jgi:hypothetical protein